MTNRVFHVEVVDQDSGGIPEAWKLTRTRAVNSSRLPVLAITNERFRTPLVMLRAADLSVLASRIDDLEQAVASIA